MSSRGSRTTVKPTPILKKSSKKDPYTEHVSVGAKYRNTGAPNNPDQPVLRQSLSHLREENSHLLNQSHRLISDLETTSHQLLKANSQIDELRGELDKEKSDSSKDKVVVLKAQLQLMEEKLSKNVTAASRLQHVTSQQEREKEEWTLKHQAMKDQLNSLQDECRKLQDTAISTITPPLTTTAHTAPSILSAIPNYSGLHTSTYSSAKTHYPLTDTSSTSSLSSKSKPPYNSSLSHSTGVSRFTSGSYHSKPTSRYMPRSTSGTSVTFDPVSAQKPDVLGSHHSIQSTPLANSTLLNSSHLSGSSSSLNSVQSTQSVRGEYSSRFQGRSYRPFSHRQVTATSTPRVKLDQGNYNSGRSNASPSSSSSTRYYEPSSSLKGVNGLSSASSDYISSRERVNSSSTGYKPSNERVNLTSTTRQYTPLSSQERVNGLSSSSSSSVGYSSWRPAHQSQLSSTHKDLKDGSKYSKFLKADLDQSTNSSSLNDAHPTSIRVHTINNTPAPKDTSPVSGISPRADLSVLDQSPHGTKSRSSLKNDNDIHSPVSMTSSVTNGDQSMKMEVERSRTKIRQLEKEVVLLEQQLTDKTQSAKHHVEELTGMRVELAQERSSLAILKQEIRDNAAEELGRARGIHSQQCGELQDQLEKTKKEKRNMERELEQIKTMLKASQSESSSLSQRVSSLHGQLDQERASYKEAMRVLQSEVKSGCERVTQLEHALEMCGKELAGHVTVVEENTQQHRSEVELLRNQVDTLSYDLSQSQEKLLHKTDLATNLQRELTETRSELQKGQSLWRQNEHEMRQCLEQSEILRQSLSKQIERLNQELKEYSTRATRQGELSGELSYAHSEIERMSKENEELKHVHKKVLNDLECTREEENRLRFELTQEQSKNNEIVRKLENSDILLQNEVRKREETETNAVRLEGEVERVGRECEGCREEVRAVEARAKQREEEIEGTLGHMQQELAKRAQQVLEMDGLLRTHQADTAARRLQLERTLTQRQADLRTRTQELEEVMVKLSEAKKREEELRQEVELLKSSEQTLSSQRDKDLYSRESEVSSLKCQLKEVESVGVAKSRELQDLKKQLESFQGRERVSNGKLVEFNQKVIQLTEDNDLLREQNLKRVQRLQETHSTLFTSHEQQATSHRLQLQQLVDQEKVRQEELSRCRAQVASLSAELAAERRVSEEARRHVAVSKAESIKYQAQVSSLQKAFSTASPPFTSSQTPSPTPPPSTITHHTHTTHPDNLPSHHTHTTHADNLPSHHTHTTHANNHPSHHTQQSLQRSAIQAKENAILGQFRSLPPHLQTVPSRGGSSSPMRSGASVTSEGVSGQMNFDPVLPRLSTVKGGIVDI